jgi:hypothetical protein
MTRYPTYIKVLNLLTLVLTLTVNGLANALPINGRNTGEIANSFPIYFLPAGYVFAIWGLIYLFLVGFVIFQFLPTQADNPRLARLGWGFVLSNLANAGWIVLFHYGQYLLAELVILALLVTLMGIYLRLEIGRQPAKSGLERWLLLIPFQIYLGWVSVAIIANTSQLLNSLGVAGQGGAAQAWFVAVTLVAVALGLAMAMRRGDPVFNLVLAWALIGIGVKQSATPLVMITAYAAAGLAVVWVILALTRFRVKAALS